MLNKGKKLYESAKPKPDKSPSKKTKPNSEIERAIEFEVMKIHIHKKNENRIMVQFCEARKRDLEKQLK